MKPYIPLVLIALVVGCDRCRKEDPDPPKTDSGVVMDSGVKPDSGLPPVDAGFVDAGQPTVDAGKPDCPLMDGNWAVDYEHVSGSCGPRKRENVQFVSGKPYFGKTCEIVAFNASLDFCSIDIVTVCRGEERADHFDIESRDRATGYTTIWRKPLKSDRCGSKYDTVWTRTPFDEDDD